MSFFEYQFPTLAEVGNTGGKGGVMVGGLPTSHLTYPLWGEVGWEGFFRVSHLNHQSTNKVGNQGPQHQKEN